MRAAERKAQGRAAGCPVAPGLGLPLLLAGLLAAGAECWVGRADAAQQQWVPSLSVKAEFDDNVEFAAAEPDADLSLWASPGLALRRTAERSWLEGGASLDVVRYRERTDLNRVDQLYQISGGSAWTERFQVQGNASYRQGSTLESQLDETGRVSRRSPLYQFRGGAGGSYGLSARTRLGLDYGYFASAYAAGGSVDFTSHDLGLLWQVDLKNERDQVSVRPAYRRFDSAGIDADDVSLTAGWRHPLTETWVLDLTGGGRYTRFDDRGARDHQWGWILDLASTWKGETTTAEVGFLADLTYGSDGVPVERERVRGAVRRQLTERWWGRLGVDLARTRDLGSSGSYRRYGSVAPEVGFRVGPSHTLAVGYRYAYDGDPDRSGDSVATRNRVWAEWQGRF